MRSVKKITGIFGSPGSTSQEQTNIPTVARDQSGERRSGQVEIRVSNCDSLYDWQKNIINNIRFGNDYFILGQPGAGKTLPVMCYWVNDVLGINVINPTIPRANIYHRLMSVFSSPDKTPKIVWAVPIIQLAININTEFRKILVELFSYLWVHFKRTPLFRSIAGQADDDRVFNQAVEYFLAKNTSVFHKGTQFNTARDNGIIIGIYESLTNLFKDPRFVSNIRLLVIDEAHEFFKRGESDDRFDQKILFLHTALNNLKKYAPNCRVLLLTGTLHPNSANEMANALNKLYKRNFPAQTIVQPGSNPAKIKVIEYDGLTNFSEQKKIIKSAILNNDWGVALILFSTKRIQELARELISELPYIGIKGVQGKKDIYEKTPTDMIKSIQYKQKEEDELNITGLPDEQFKSLKKLGAENIQDPLLRECVARGFGFFYRGSEEFGGEITSNDKIIIENLFRNRKISAIIATDSIGIGVNIDIQKMYLPSASKYMDGSIRQISNADLSQLLNRVGRSAVSFGIIYTPRSEIPIVVSALDSTPENFDKLSFNIPNVTILKLKNIIRRIRDNA